MKIHLGYIASPLSLDNFTYAHTMTYNAYQKLGKDLATQKLNKILLKNLDNFKQVLEYNHYNKIYFYRFSHNLVPLATCPYVSFDYIRPYQNNWEKLGKLVKKYKIRLDSHPDQYCVLNSLNPKVVENTITHLEFHQKLYQAMKLNGKAIIHVGSGLPNKNEAKKRFIENFRILGEKEKNMILLENDDKIFDVDDVLELCQLLKIPMVLDYHHNRCCHRKELTKEKIKEIFATWENESLPPKVHFSSPKSMKEKRSHSEYLDKDDFMKFLALLKEVNQDVDIMLECKARDLALFKLVRQLKCEKGIRFINDTTFEM